METKKSTTRELFEQSELNKELNKFLWAVMKGKSRRFLKDLEDGCLREYRKQLKESNKDPLQERWQVISTTRSAHMGVREGKLRVIISYRKRRK